MRADIFHIPRKRAVSLIAKKSPLTINSPVMIALPADIADKCLVQAGMFGKTMEDYVIELVSSILNQGCGP